MPPSAPLSAAFISKWVDAPSRIEVWRDGRAVPFKRGLALAVDMIRRCSGSGGQVIFVGNGGSAAVAGHMALDFWNAGRIRTLGFNDPVQLTCMANDRGYREVFAEPIRRTARPGDAIVAVSSSGRSENILRAAEAALAQKCAVLTLTGFSSDNPLRSMGGLSFYVPSVSYGLVELTHLGILTAILEEFIDLPKNPSDSAPRPHFWRKTI